MNMKVGLSILVLLALVSLASARSQPPPPAGRDGILVGHISHIEGQLLRYVSEESDWVATVKDAPFGLDDALYADENSKAEIIIPNDTWLRTGGSTQIQLIALKRDVTEVDMASGVGRFYNRSAKGVIKVTTEFGYVVARRGTTFDLYVGDESLEVIPVTGRVDFFHQGKQAKFEIRAGSSLIADGTRVSMDDANVDADWDDWNGDRDRLWRKRLDAIGDSGRYLPPALRDEAYILEENGRWEEVRYEGRIRRFWRPTTVAVGWSPFTVGRWTEYHGDHTWIPAEHFGYVTHHYGNWISIGGYWYWAPPVVSVRVDTGPFLAIGFGWCPGRVGWIYSGFSIGWVPLAWHEPYYAYRRWSSWRTTVINTVNINQININIGGYLYLDSAIVVNRDSFYRTNSYHDLRIADVGRDVITANYRAAPVVSDRVIDNFRSIKERHNFIEGEVLRKPHDIVRDRILHNEKLAGRVDKVSAAGFEQKLRSSKSGKVDREATIGLPKVGNKLVSHDKVFKAKGEAGFQEKALKTTTKQIHAVQGTKAKGSTKGSTKGYSDQHGAAMQIEKTGKMEQFSRSGGNGKSGGSGREMHGGHSPKVEHQGKERGGHK
ncbi:MAG: hypothetical protein ACD_75C02307G0001 [uncultured bacterium]|nr:MAG: hypothetical protein ACD_75C02307G0001 [uncultured bacterium]